MKTSKLTSALLVLNCTAAMAGTQGSIAGTDGDAVEYYAAGPEDADAGVVILHDWFGMSDHTRASVDRLGEIGLRAVAVDLYGGESAQDHARAGELSGALDPEAAQNAVRAVLDDLNAGERPVVVVGYSMGAQIALRAGAENPEQVTAVSVIYGGSYGSVSDEALAQVGPTLAITGAADEWSYPEHAELERRMRTVGNHMETYVYPGADHAFAQPLYNEGKSFDANATAAMQNVLDAFLARHLNLNE